MLKTGISNRDYHGSVDLLSRSTAWNLLTTCPQKVRHELNYPKASTPAQILGSAFHSATLEPEKFDDEFAVKPDEIDGQGPRTKHYKEAFGLLLATMTWLWIWRQVHWIIRSYGLTCLKADPL